MWAVHNTLRLSQSRQGHDEVYIAFLAAQAEALTLPVVVSRLVNARRHRLALQISSLLGMGPERVGTQVHARLNAFHGSLVSY